MHFLLITKNILLEMVYMVLMMKETISLTVALLAIVGIGLAPSFTEKNVEILVSSRSNNILNNHNHLKQQPD